LTPVDPSLSPPAESIFPEPLFREDPSLPRRERDKLLQRARMLAAALELFSEKGFHNVSMQEIAHRAEYATGTLYGFFASKEDLYRALMLDLSGRMEAALGAALGQGRDEMDKIGRYLQAKGRVFRDNLNLVRLYFAEARGASFNLKTGPDRDLWRAYERSLAALAEVFAAGIARGLFQARDPYFLALALDSLANASLLSCVRDPERFRYEQVVETMTDIFFGAVKKDAET